jgi:alkylation response protein AidB-like acyl-CoA dehydrogenase
MNEHLSGAPRTRSGFAELVDRLDRIAPVLREHGPANEASGALVPVVMDALRDCGAFSMGMPAEFGGHQLTALQALDVIGRVSACDAATGWVLMILSTTTGSTAAYLDDEAAQELFGSGCLPLIAGQGTRPGIAARTDEGYLLSGSWSFASGLRHADHLQTAARVEQTGEPLAFILPVNAEGVTLVDDWDVSGLRSTGSISYHAESVFVPASHTFPLTTTTPRRGGALYRAGLVDVFAMCHSGWALGVGHRLLEEMRRVAADRTGAPHAAVDTAEFHADYARAEAALRSAHAWLREVWADNEATLEAGDMLTTTQETLTRLALHNATWTAHEVGATVHRWAGTAALRAGDLQRFLRDLQAGTQHITVGPVIRQNCGRLLAGLAPDERWRFLDVVHAAT